MRVTNKMLSNTFLSDMRTNLENMKKLQEQMTSGKEVRRPSDDPFKVARAMQLNTDINTNKQYKVNINDTINWLDTTDTALGQLGDVLQRVRELSISAGNAGYSEDERIAIKDEINEKIGEFAQILNTNYDGAYVFGGTRGTFKPVGTISVTNYDNSYKVKVDDLSSWSEKKLIIGEKEITLPKIPSEDGESIDTLEKLANAINERIADGLDEDSESPLKNFKVEAFVGEGKLVFINNNPKNSGADIEIKETDDAGNTNILATVKSPTKSLETNTSLVYLKNNGDILDTTSAVDGAQYNMIGKNLKVQISQGVVMEYNVTATDVLEFKDSDGTKLDLREIFSRIVNHLDGRSDDGTTEDTLSVSYLSGKDLDDIDAAIDNLLKLRSEVGAKQNRMDSALVRNEEENSNMAEVLSKTEDIDITEKIMEYATMQTVYLASLQTSAKVLQPSLIDYL